MTGNNYVVLEGIKPGDKIVVSGTQFLVDGAPVLDGVLVAVSDRTVDSEAIEATRYAILPTRGGPTIALTDPSADLLAHLGERLWVAVVGDAAPMAFGVIGER
jgi:hypothetical protein